MVDSSNINDMSASKASTLEARQATQVSSLSAFTMKMQEKTDKQVKSMEKRIDNIMRIQAMQKKRADYSLKATDKSVAANRELSSSTAKILGAMNESVRQLAIGTKNITTSTAIGSKELLSQYGKAISEDVNYNKQNMLATSLSQSSPIFGYFAAKFMETDVFRGAADKIKFRLGSAINDAFLVSKGMLRSLSDKAADMFTRTPKIQYSKESKRYMGDIRVAAEDIKDEINKRKSTGKIKQAQTGGYVKKGGLVNVHTGEIITPIEKLPKIQAAMNRVSGSDVTQKTQSTLSSISGMLAENALQMEDFVGESKKVQRTLIKSFVHGYKTARDPGEKTWQDRMLKATVEMKIAMTGMTSRLRIAWQRVLTEHPFFKNMLGAFEIFKMSVFSPIKFLFGMRGGYRRYLPRSQNQFENISQGINVTFVQQMIRLDKIIFYLKTITDITLEKEKKLKDRILGTGKDRAKDLEEKFEQQRAEKEFSLFGQIKDFMSGKKKKEEEAQGWRKKLFSTFTAQLDLDVETMKKSKISGFGDMFNPFRVLRGAGLGKEDIKAKTEKQREQFSEFAQKGKSKYSDIKGRAKEKKAGLLTKLPKFDDGAFIDKTGLAVVHEGEAIAPANKMKSIMTSISTAAVNMKDTAKDLKDVTLQKGKEYKDAYKWKFGRKKYKKKAQTAKDAAMFLPNMAIESGKDVKKLWEEDKKRFAVQAGIFGLTKGLMTGSSFIGEDGKFDKAKFDKNYVQPAKKAQIYAKDKLDPSIQYAKDKSAAASAYTMDKTREASMYAKGKAGQATEATYGLGKQVLKFFGFGLTLEEKIAKLQTKQQKKLHKRELKHQKRLQKQRDRYGKEFKTHRKTWLKMDNRVLTDLKQKLKIHTDKIKEKYDDYLIETRIRETKLSEFKQKLRKNTVKKQKEIREKGTKLREAITLKFFKKGLFKQAKVIDKWNRKTEKLNEKTLKKQEKRTERLLGRHTGILKNIFNRQKRAEIKRAKQMENLENVRKKLENKRNKMLQRIENLKLKAKRRQQKWENKLKEREEKYKLKQELKATKLESKLKFLKEKKKMVRRTALDKIRNKKMKHEMKIKEILAKAKLKKQMKQMKVQIKEAKILAKKEEKKLKQELKAARREEWRQRKQMMKERWEYFKSAPRRFKAFQEKIDKGLKSRMDIAKQGIKKLSKIQYGVIRVGDLVNKGFKKIKSLLGGVWKFIIMGAGMIKDVVFGGFKTFILPMITSALGSLGGLLLKGLGALGAVGIGSAAVGGIMGYQDVKSGIGKAKEWGTSKTAAGVGGFLGGTKKGLAGAGRGALKGAAIGAAIGTIVPGFGTAIGGAVGAVAGGLLGAIGGENIAKGFHYIAPKIKKFAIAVGKFVFFPMYLGYKLMKSTIADIKESYKKEGMLGVAKNILWKAVKLSMWPIYLPLKIAKMVADWGAKKFGIEKQWNKIKETITKAITSPLVFMGNLVTSFASSIRDMIASYVEKIPFIGTKLSSYIRSKPMVAEKSTMTLSPEIMKEKVALERGAGIHSQIKDVKIPQAQTGGYVSKGGLIRVHAGELITPLSDEIRDRVESVVTDGSMIAKRNAIGSTAQTKFMIEEQKKAQKEAMDDLAKSNNSATAAVINNITTSMNNSMQSIANNLGGKDKGHFDQLAQQILQGDLT